MTDTTTADQMTDENLVEAAQRAAEEAGAKSLATITPDQRTWTPEQIALLRQIGIEDATQADVDLFFHYCRTTGLDPFRKQIYMIGRKTKLTEWVPRDPANPDGQKDKREKWVVKYTIQTGIDGYRRNGREAAKRQGDTLAFEGPYWCGEDGDWREVWPAKTPPTAAKYTIVRNGERFSAVVHYDEFVQTNAVYEGEGRNRHKVRDEPNSMWEKMPRNQTAKCAEAMAWRRAYPDDFSGLDLEDAAQPTIIDEEGNVEQPAKPRRAGGSGVDAVRKAREEREAKKREQVIDGDVETPTEQPKPKTTREKLNAVMFRYLGAVGLTTDSERNNRLIVLTRIAGRDELITSSNDLTDTEVRTVIKTFEEVGDHAAANDMVTSVLNAWVATQPDKGTPDDDNGQEPLQ